MKQETVYISLNSGILKLKFNSNSIFLSGTHNIFFSNILGFEFDKVSSEFTIPFNSISQSNIIELTNYLNEYNIDLFLSDNITDVFKNFDENIHLLENAKVLGSQLKKKPTRKIIVPNLIRPLKAYQIPAVSHMVNLNNSANFSVPGSGKTTIVLSAFAILKAKKEVDKLIVIGPRASFMSWEEEYFNCFLKKPKSIRLIGTKRIRKNIYREFDKMDIMLLTYQMACNDEEQLLVMLNKYKILLVLDESHNVKRMEGGKWSETVLRFAQFAKRKVILSGTPAPNSLQDLWSQLTFLWTNPPLLGTVDQFRQRIVGQNKSTISEIKSELYPFYWRIRKKELKLKKPIFHRIDVKMKPYQKAIYDSLAIRILSDLIKEPEHRQKLRIWRKARMVRLLQTATNPSLLNKYSLEFKIPPVDASGLSVDRIIDNYSDYETPPKIHLVLDLVKSLLMRKQKVIIWTSFIHNIETLLVLLKDYGVRPIYGDIPKDANEDVEFNREKFIKDFKKSPNCRILIANPGACAESVSLHKVCHHAIYLDRTFNGVQYMQSLDRIHRIGLEPNEQVHYYILRTKNTIDELIDNRLREKQKRMLKLLDDDFAILDLESSTEDFSELSEEEIDFNALIKQLEKQYGR